MSVAPTTAAALGVSERVLRQNWLEGERDGRRYAYTRPSPTRYPWQWYWDSCFAAVVWRRFDPARARDELESLLAAQREDGFIGHTIFWDRPVSLTRLPFYNVASRRAFQTETIQPPLLGWAWRIAVGDPAAEPGIAAQSTGSAPTATSRATACSGSCSRTSPASTPRPSSTRSGGAGRTPGSDFPCSSRGTAASASTRGASSATAAPCSARRSSTCSGRSRCSRSGAPR